MIIMIQIKESYLFKLIKQIFETVLCILCIIDFILFLDFYDKTIVESKFLFVFIFNLFFIFCIYFDIVIINSNGGVKD